MSRPPAKWAVAACGSMGWLCRGGSRWRVSTRTGAAAKAAAASPRRRWAGWPPLTSSGVYVSGWSSARTTSCGSGSSPWSAQVTRTAAAAARASSRVSATARATYQRAVRDGVVLEDVEGGVVGRDGEAGRVERGEDGEDPGRASASAVSTEVSLPQVTPAATGQA